MAEIILVFVIVMLLIYIAWQTYEFKLERKQLLNAILAKTPEQLRDLDIADKVVIKAPPTNAQPDLVAINDMSEDDFDQHIKEQLENG